MPTPQIASLITPLYAALFGLMFVALTLRVIALRRTYQRSLGDGDQPLLRRAIRVHGNFAEYVPFALLLLYFVELQQRPAVWLHVLGGSLVLARVLHAYGVSQVRERLPFRIAGLTLTMLVMTACALLLLVRALGLN